MGKAESCKEADWDIAIGEKEENEWDMVEGRVLSRTIADEFAITQSQHPPKRRTMFFGGEVWGLGISAFSERDNYYSQPIEVWRRGVYRKKRGWEEISAARAGEIKEGKEIARADGRIKFSSPCSAGVHSTSIATIGESSSPPQKISQTDVRYACGVPSRVEERLSICVDAIRILDALHWNCSVCPSGDGW